MRGSAGNEHEASWLALDGAFANADVHLAFNDVESLIVRAMDVRRRGKASGIQGHIHETVPSALHFVLRPDGELTARYLDRLAFPGA
jgi:hypothetical protein